ncbi:MAG: BlaI/MecI/CopY family transcriptional regulator [Planctomycetaceae bacterium]|nr:BlaI/MecI/CopY family transcriptional regulator [Planctomycetaceae bacterium]
MSEIRISDAEWKVMHVVWKLGRVTGNDVIAEVTPDTGWSPNTVRTLLTRLADKGILHAGKQQGQKREYPMMVYTPRVSREVCIAAHGQSFLERVFDGDTSELLVHFVKDRRLTSEQAAKLRELLDTIPDENDSRK